MDLRMLALDDTRRCQQRRQIVAQLRLATAGEEANHRDIGRDAVPLEKRRAFFADLHLIGKGITDIFDVDIETGVKGRLKREDGGKTVDDFGDTLHPSAPPRPDLRADIIEDGNAKLPGNSGEAQIEIGEIDEDEKIWTLRSLQNRLEALKSPPDGGEVSDHFDNPHDGNGFAGDDDLATGRGHSFPADAEEA